jgi:hypothetical protein
MSIDLRDIDKLDETISFRIPEFTKHLIDKMPNKYRRKMNEEVLKTISKVIHESKFDPNNYLKSE